MPWRNQSTTKPDRVSRRAGGRSGLKRFYRAQMNGVRSPLRMTQTIEAPLVDHSTSEDQAPKWLVTIYNNDHNTYDEVMTILMLATGCDSDEAYIEAWEVDHYGHCIVHRASEEECQGVAEVVATIGIKVEATPES